MKMRFLILGGLALFTLSGCYRYACPAPDGVSCKPISQIYKETKDGPSATRSLSPKKSQDKKQVKEVSDKSKGRKPSVAVAEQEEDPISISGPVILPIKIYKYIDSEGDLHRPGYVFLVINKEQWIVDGDSPVSSSTKPVRYQAKEDSKNVPAAAQPVAQTESAGSQVEGETAPSSFQGTFWENVSKDQSKFTTNLRSSADGSLK
jgi:type IV conjugative transfer system lipoprotein TraV